MCPVGHERVKPVRLCEELTLWSSAYLEKLIVPQPGKKFPSPSTSWNLKIHCHVHKGPPLVRIASHISPVCVYHSISWRSTLLLCSHLGFASGVFPSVFPAKFRHSSFISPIGATCPIHLILRDLITLVTYGEEYKSWNSSLCNFLQSPYTSCLWGPILILSARFLNALSLCSSLTERDKT
jgi:hypothetical protein